MAEGNGYKEAEEARKRAKEERKARAEQFKELDRQAEEHYKNNADTFRREQEYRDRAFENMLDQQMRMLGEFYSAADKGKKDYWSGLIKDQQDRLEQQLSEMNRVFKQSQKYMTKQDKLAYQVMYQNRVDDLKALNSEILERSSDVFDGLGRMFDNADRGMGRLAISWTERLDKMFTDLRNYVNTLNLDKIADHLQENVDSVFENKRQVAAVSGNEANYDMFFDYTDELNKSIEGYDRNRSSEMLSNIMKDFAINDVKEAAMYMKTMAGADLLGISKDDLSKLMWADLNSGSQGQMVRSLSNMAVALDNADGLYVHSNTILAKLNESTEAILGLAEGDEKKKKKMYKSVANLEALSESQANEGVDNMVDMLQEFQTMTVPELFNDDRAAGFASMLGVRLEDLPNILQDTNKTAELIGAYQSKLQSMSDNDLYAYKDVLGFDKVATMKRLAGANDLVGDYRKAAAATDTSLINSENNAQQNLMVESSDKLVTWMQGFKNSLTSNPVVAWASNVADKLDLSMANAANMAIVGQAGLNGFKWLFKEGGARLIGQKLTGMAGFFTGGGFMAGLRSLGSTIVSGIGGFFSKLGSLGSGLGSSAGGLLSGLGAKIGSFMSSSAGFGGTTLTAFSGTVGSLVSALGPVAGGFLTFSDAVKGFDKSVEWLGKEGDSITGKVSSTIGGLLGGNSKGFSGFLGGAGKGALLGAFAGPIGMAIGGALGGTLGALGGEKISKFAKGTFDLVSDVSNEAFNVMGAGVLAISDVASEFGPVGKSMGDMLSNSWKSVSDTKSKIEAVWANPNKGLVAKIGGTVGSLFSGTGSLAKSIISGSLGISSQVWSGIKSMASSTWDTISEFAKGSWSVIKDTANNVWNGLFNGATAFIDKITSILKGVFDFTGNVSSGVNKVVDGISSGAGSVFSSIKGFITGGNDNKDNRGFSFVSSMSSALDNSSSNLVSQPLPGFAEGLSYVPNDGLAMIHKGEAILTESQANVIRADADGGISSLNELADNPRIITREKTEPYSNIISADNKYFMKSLNESISASLEDNTNVFKDMAETFSDKFMDESTKNVKKKQTLLGSIFAALGASGNSSSLSGGGFFSNLISKVSNMFNSSSPTRSFSEGSSGGNSRRKVTMDTSGTPAQSVSGSGAESKIWNYFAGKGLTSQGIAGLMGNLSAESGLSPINLENGYEGSLGMNDSSYTASVDNGSYTNFVNDSAGYGLAQWTYYTRKQKLLDYADSTKRSIGDLDMQLEFLWNELSSGYSSVLNILKKTGSVQDASDAMLYDFENPAVPNSGYRASLSQGFYDKFASYEVGTPFIPEDQLAMVHQGEMIVPKDNNPFNGLKANGDTITSDSVSVASNDNSDVVETLKWMVSRLEAKLDRVIAASGNSSVKSRRSLDTSDMDYVLGI